MKNKVLILLLLSLINIQASQAEAESLQSLYNEIVCISDTSKRVKLVIFGPEQNTKRVFNKYI